MTEIVAVRLQDIHECPPNPGGVGTQRRCNLGGKALGGVVEIFQDPAASPVDVGAVLEENVDEGIAEEGVPPNHLGKGHRQHSGGQGIDDLVLHDLRGLSRVFRVDDDLNVGEVGNGVYRYLLNRVDACQREETRSQQYQQLVTDGPVDDIRQHGHILAIAFT